MYGKRRGTAYRYCLTGRHDSVTAGRGLCRRGRDSRRSDTNAIASRLHRLLCCSLRCGTELTDGGRVGYSPRERKISEHLSGDGDGSGASTGHGIWRDRGSTWRSWRDICFGNDVAVLLS